jgi:hypothetical protein
VVVNIPRRSLSVNLLWQHTLFPLSIGMLLARDSTVGICIPSSISLPANLFTRSVTHDPVTNSLVTMSSIWWCITEWAQRYLSVIRSDKSQSRFVPTQ